MLNLILVHDHSSPDIGTNCALCHQHLVGNINLDDFHTYQLDGDSCDTANLQGVIAGLDEVPFVFVAYSHGSHDGLVSHNNGCYVNTANSYFFAASLFYTNACYSASSVRQALMHNECISFVGYEDDVKLPNKEEDDIIFIECENHAIIEFLNTGKGIGLCFEEMKERYTRKIQELTEQKSVVLAARLGLNRDCLIIDGDTTITRDYFTRE